MIYVYWYECLSSGKTIRTVVDSVWSTLEGAQHIAEENNKDSSQLQWLGGFWDGEMITESADVRHHISRMDGLDIP